MDQTKLQELYPDVYNIMNINLSNKQKKFTKKLNEPISKADKRGFIYGFRKKTDETTINNFWIKLGRTERYNPMDRIITEWNGVPIFVIETAYSHKLEVLVHIIFDFAHKIRYDEKTNKREIEWFYFEKFIDVPSIVSKINILMNNLFNVKSIKIDITNNPDEELSSNKTNRKYFCCFPLLCKTKNEKCLCNIECCSYKTIVGNFEVGCCDLCCCYVNKI